MTSLAKEQNMSQAPNAIEVRDLCFAYQASSLVLNIPNWTLAQGKTCFLYGPSGSGKSTLLNLLSGTLSLKASAVNNQNTVLRVLGQDINTLSNAQKDRFRAHKMGVVFQRLNLIPYLTVAQNISLSANFTAKKDKAHKAKRLEQVLDNLSLPLDILDQKAQALSMGQQQRVAIARALYHEPELLIVDEPTSALDADATDKFMALLLGNVTTQNASLLFVSHDMRLAKNFDESLPLAEINQTTSVSSNTPSQTRET